MATIEAKHYGDARRALMADPIVQRLANGLSNVPMSEMAHDDGTPRFEFMQAANREYDKRGGERKAHIGAVAEALIRILKDNDDDANRVRTFTPDEWAGTNEFDDKPKEEGTKMTTATAPKKTTAKKTSRYNPEYAKAYRERKAADDWEIYTILPGDDDYTDDED